MLYGLLSLLLLGFLVIVHEMGHFLVARWSGVRVLRFSVGFGPKLLAWKRGHTEYAVSAIPLGGYVKMAGEQHSEAAQQPWEYLAQPIGVRAKIVFAGPFVNYLVAVMSLWLVYVIGYPELLPVVGMITESPAQAAGLQSGDRIISVEGRSVQSWEEVNERVRKSANKPLGMAIERDGEPLEVTVTPRQAIVLDAAGRPQAIGEIGVVPGGGSNPVVGEVEQTPAKAAGLEKEDHIRSINDRPLRTWDEMTRLIYEAPGQPLDFQIERGGALRKVTITPHSRLTIDPFGRPKKIGLIGIAPSGALTSYRVGPLEAIPRTFQQHYEWSTQTFLALWSVMTGRLSLRDSVTGPIGIVYLTSEAVRMGFAPVLFLLSLFSLSLAIFNFFPIPILDGGHLFFLALERLRGKPVSIAVQERSAQVSFVFLMLFVLVICINDISRFGLLEKVAGWIGR